MLRLLECKDQHSNWKVISIGVNVPHEGKNLRIYVGVWAEVIGPWECWAAWIPKGPVGPYGVRKEVSVVWSITIASGPSVSFLAVLGGSIQSETSGLEPHQRFERKIDVACRGSKRPLVGGRCRWRYIWVGTALVWMVKIKILYFIQALPLLQKIGIRIQSEYMRTNTPNRVRLLAVRTASASEAVSTAVQDNKYQYNIYD